MRTLRFIICFACVIFVPPGNAQSSLTTSEQRAIVDAVEDEIYDYNLQENFRSVTKALKPDQFQVPLFLLTKEGRGTTQYVIYRLMPFGEIYREVEVGEEGQMAHLFRNPRSGFPPDAAAMQTVYFDDDRICQAKHDATRLFFLVDMSPTPERIREAIERQKKRYGFSNLEEEKAKHKTSKSPRKK